LAQRGKTNRYGQELAFKLPDHSEVFIAGEFAATAPFFNQPTLELKTWHTKELILAPSLLKVSSR
jgi:hypothetical protein